MSIEDRLHDAKQRVEQVNMKRTRAEIEVDNAKARFTSARSVLKDEFGLNTGDEITARIDSLKAEIDKNLAEAEEALKAAGA